MTIRTSKYPGVVFEGQPLTDAEIKKITTQGEPKKPAIDLAEAFDKYGSVVAEKLRSARGDVIRKLIAPSCSN